MTGYGRYLYAIVVTLELSLHHSDRGSATRAKVLSRMTSCPLETMLLADWLRCSPRWTLPLYSARYIRYLMQPSLPLENDAARGLVEM
jgi:hypothetical protein